MMFNYYNKTNKAPRAPKNNNNPRTIVAILVPFEIEEFSMLA